jgi:septal ring-binding cell division protein DamX
MRISILAASFAIAASIAATAPAQAQTAAPAPAPTTAPAPAARPALSVEMRSGSNYSFSLEQVSVIGGGALAGFVVGQWVFMGHLGPVLTGAAGGYLANLWYTSR